ncbi:MAG: rhomboid family intramembrane serine protease [Bacteroidetes bacterium]|nr:rhomboid family intramembrane serine protease [Bacteroidota bacterium]
MSIWEEIKSTFRNGTALTKLLYLNGAIFLVVKLLEMISVIATKSAVYAVVFVDWLSVPAFLPELAGKFWTPLTYMFLHQEFLHFIFNLLWLYWFGKIFLQFLDQRKLVAAYILGGLTGALFFIGFFNIVPAFRDSSLTTGALGASAAVMAVVTAVAVWVPEYEIMLFLIGRIRLKYLALFMFLITTVFDFSANTGGKVAHIGGALFGLLYAISLKRGYDPGKGINMVIDFLATIFRPRKKIRVTYRKPPRDDYQYNEMKTEKQQEINRILDKISKGGYDSLTSEEKKRLFSESQGKN